MKKEGRGTPDHYEVRKDGNLDTTCYIIYEWRHDKGYTITQNVTIIQYFENWRGLGYYGNSRQE